MNEFTRQNDSRLDWLQVWGRHLATGLLSFILRLEYTLTCTYNLFVFRLHLSITLRRKAQDGRSILFCSRNIHVVPKEIFPVHCLAFYPYNAIGYLVLCVQCSCHYSIV